MSKYVGSRDAITVTKILKKKQDREKITMVTCYDAAFAKIVDQTSVDMVLVGDSLGNVMLGFDDTIRVTMDHMVHHTAAVSRVLKRAFIAADMPFLSYNVSVEQALVNAARLVQEGGAQAVKVEGGHHIVPQVRAMVSAGIPVIGHLGLTPQSIHTLGGFKVQGRGEDAEKAMLAAARELEEAGAFALVLELVPRLLAEKISTALKIPTIGIGAGPATDGQVLVLHDLLGFDTGFKPKFLKHYANIGQLAVEAIDRYVADVTSGAFPNDEHSFS